MRSLYKIVHTTCHTGWGGLERRIFNESVWMLDKGHQIVIIAPKDTPLFTRARKFGFRVYDISFKPLGIIKDYNRLIQIFETEQPHILNTHGNADSKIALLAAKKAGVPCRILSRHISAHVRNTWYNRKIYKQLNHFIFTTADYTTRHLQQVFKLKALKIFSMPSGIMEPESLTPKEDARKALAAELSLDPGTRFIGFAGRVSTDKGVATILKALRLIQSEIPHHIAIVGDGTPIYLAELKALAQRLNIGDRVHFVGFKEDVWPYYRAFDCKILASINKNGIPFEGVPQALLEAMYSSCPVIGSKSGGITDIIVHQKTGLLFDPKNPEELSDMILNTLNQEAATMERVHLAREQVKKHHTIDAMGRNITRIYRLHQVKLDNRYLPR
ncbi:MAG: glycosyltransferase family 4 protein [Proteobacteria bacterium]|nr:glycosyltransferase family 4 protein [Desulfobacula sp.]MBU3951122.1 glycosyltransferase family 4 protein [Pseudomonadota bacterium]MBU4130192.1 glycosyltransferase family 4 protein [Pseudomonadota bacterium]